MHAQVKVEPLRACVLWPHHLNALEVVEDAGSDLAVGSAEMLQAAKNVPLHTPHIVLGGKGDAYRLPNRLGLGRPRLDRSIVQLGLSRESVLFRMEVGVNFLNFSKIFEEFSENCILGGPKVRNDVRFLPRWHRPPLRVDLRRLSSHHRRPIE